MPIGVLINALSVAVGGILGGFLQGRFSESFQKDLNLVFGLCSVGMGISATAQMENLPAVVLALIAGGILGLISHLGQRISDGAKVLQQRLSHVDSADEEKNASFLTVIVLFCASGTGIYGALLSGFNGDHSVLIAKSVLDLFSAAIFSCSIGSIVALVAVPQCGIFLLLFLLAKFIFPITSPTIIADFKACGGIIMIATGLRMAGICAFPIADLIPAMALVMPLSGLWSRLILPLL